MTTGDVDNILRVLGVDNARWRGNTVQCSCPLAKWLHDGGQDKHPSFGVIIRNDGFASFHCFTCHQKGTMVGLLYKVNEFIGGLDDMIKSYKKLNGFGFSVRLDNAQKLYGREKDTQVEKPATLYRERLKSLHNKFKGIVPRYLLMRGISIDIARDFEIGYDKASERVVFPLRNLHEELVGLVGRGIFDWVDPRYKNYWGGDFKKRGIVFGENKVDTSLKFINVVEGMTDVLYMATLGFSNVVGLLGSEVTKEQIAKIKIFGGTVHLFMDGDSGGDLCRRKLVDGLSGRVMLIDHPLPRQKDPALMTKQELDTLSSILL